MKKNEPGKNDIESLANSDVIKYLQSYFGVNTSFAPFVGGDYFERYDGEKILFVLESHYVSNYDYTNKKTRSKSKILEFLEYRDNTVELKKLTQTFSDEWYEFGEKFYRDKITKLRLEKKIDFDYDENDEEWLNTSMIINSNIENYKKNKSIRRAHLTYMKIAKAFYYHKEGNSQYIKNDLANILNKFAIMNYFSRPSLVTGGQISLSPNDKKYAFDRFEKVLKILDPNIVIFCSKLAYDTFKEYQNSTKSDCTTCCRIIYTKHPAWPGWWKRESKNMVEEVINGG